MLLNLKYTYDCSLFTNVNELLIYLDSINYYDPLDKLGHAKFDGSVQSDRRKTRLLSSYNDKFDIILTEGRKGGKEIANTLSCPLCFMFRFGKNPILNKVVGLLWNRFIIAPNPFPYVTRHLLFISSYHNTDTNEGSQDMIFEPFVLYSMLLSYALLDFNGSMFFSHYAGNSLDHFHYHYTSDNFKINNYLTKNNVLHDTITPNGNSFGYVDDANCFIGFIFTGDKLLSIYKDIFTLLLLIKNHGLKVNIGIYQSSSKRFKVGIFPRHSLDKSVGNVGSSDMFGYLITNDIIDVDVFMSKILQTCHNTMLTPTVLHSLYNEFITNAPAP